MRCADAIRCDARPFNPFMFGGEGERELVNERARGNQSRVNVLRLFVYGQSSCQSVAVFFVSTNFDYLFFEVLLR